ncbi:hypothetical protein K438DRAFT_1750846 [Mycena galopus ATCC 62051]|nr:hypothetical protein K438DRAFT_1750846 [Mycena galopus ATCC 62051]
MAGGNGSWGESNSSGGGKRRNKPDVPRRDTHLWVEGVLCSPAEAEAEGGGHVCGLSTLLKPALPRMEFAPVSCLVNRTFRQVLRRRSKGSDVSGPPQRLGARVVRSNLLRRLSFSAAHPDPAGWRGKAPTPLTAGQSYVSERRFEPLNEVLILSGGVLKDSRARSSFKDSCSFGVVLSSSAQTVRYHVIRGKYWWTTGLQMSGMVLPASKQIRGSEDCKSKTARLQEPVTITPGLPDRFIVLCVLR